MRQRHHQMWFDPLCPSDDLLITCFHNVDACWCAKTAKHGIVVKRVMVVMESMTQAAKKVVHMIHVGPESSVCGALHHPCGILKHVL